jgi:hypothetical protein
LVRSYIQAIIAQPETNMKLLLSIVAFTAAALVVPVSATAQTHVHVIVSDHSPMRANGPYDLPARHVIERDHRARPVYASSAWDVRHDRYVPPRRWIDRNNDGMDDRRGRRDLDRDGTPDRYDADLDNDGIANRYDRDIDGDGIPNRRDRRPDNPHAR